MSPIMNSAGLNSKKIMTSVGILNDKFPNNRHLRELY